MRERLKVFTFVSGHGETVGERAHGVGHHVTVCLWHTPEEGGPIVE
jgi:hypothetical protein